MSFGTRTGRNSRAAEAGSDSSVTPVVLQPIRIWWDRSGQGRSWRRPTPRWAQIRFTVTNTTTPTNLTCNTLARSRFAIPRECGPGDPTCDCALHQVSGTDEWAPSSPNRPLCQAPDGSYGTTQYFAKAYPPSRVLEVLSGLSSSAFLGSICPKLLDPGETASSAYGYNAMLNGLLRDVAANTGIVCLWSDMPLADDGRIRCRLIERGPPGMSCAAPGRSAAEAADVRALEASLDDGSFPEDFGASYCEIDQLGGAPRDPASDAFACANDLALPSDLAGFCYISLGAGLGNPALLEQCPSDWQRRFRLAPGTRIRSGARVFSVCDPKFILD